MLFVGKYKMTFRTLPDCLLPGGVGSGGGGKGGGGKTEMVQNIGDSGFGPGEPRPPPPPPHTQHRYSHGP